MSELTIEKQILSKIVELSKKRKNYQLRWTEKQIEKLTVSIEVDKENPDETIITLTCDHWDANHEKRG